jgi:hypothetical protein
MLMIYLATAAAATAVVAALEWGVRVHERAHSEVIAESVPAMMKQLQTARISGREIGNQMLVHNVALFSGHPDPGSVDTLYVGTSRTKVLRPVGGGHPKAVNASGNTYNEISYGLLLQAEAARLQFPSVRRVYFEASMLLRRPGRLVLEPDHRVYLPLLESLLPLRDDLPGADALRAEVVRAKQSPRGRKWRLHLLDHRSDMRLTALFGQAAEGSGKGIPVRQDPLFTQLDTSGQRLAAPGPRMPRERQAPEITNEHVKVQRLRNVAEWAPWDGLFDMVARWGRQHGIEVVLFQPPVRSDLYRFKHGMGMPAHVADLERVARQYDIPFIDLNRPELGYMADWSLFSDEDHMETCVGVVLLQSALEVGYQWFKREGTLLPRLELADVQRRSAVQLARCTGFLTSHEAPTLGLPSS